MERLDLRLQPVVGIDVGKRRLAIGWPYWSYSRDLDLGTAVGDRNAELVAMRQWLVQAIPAGAHLWIEQTTTSHGTSASAVEGLNETIGMILAASPWASWHKIGQSTWKAQVVGHGHADKDQVSDWLLEHHPALWEAAGGQEDRIDAMCVGLYGCMVESGEIDPVIPSKRRRKRAAQT